MQFKLVSLCLACSFLPAPAGPPHAQSSSSECGPLQVTVSPDPAPYGERIKVTATNISGSLIVLPQPCLLTQVHAGSRFGPTIWSVGCIQVYTYLIPGGSLEAVWDQSGDYGQMPMGLYYLELIGAPGPCIAPVEIGPCPQGSFSSFGAGCGAGTCSVLPGSPKLVPQGCPVIGSSFELVLAEGDCASASALIMGASKTAWGGQPLPLDLGGGCLLHVSVDAVFTAPAVTGKASYTLPIPSDPVLQGARAYFQGGTFAGGALKVSHALEVVVG